MLSTVHMWACVKFHVYLKVFFFILIQILCE